MDASLELYRVFYHVAKTLSFSKAAGELYVSQSAVSQNIRQLEKKLECPLFVRNTKNVYLTVDGEMLYKQVEQAFACINRAEQYIAMRRHPYEAELRIASTDTICKYHLLPKIKILTQEFPKIKFNITNGTSPACMAMLEKSSIDFAIVNLSEYTDKEKFTVEKNYDFRDVFVVSKDNKALTGRSLNLEELCGYPLLALDKGTVSRHFLDSIFSLRGMTFSTDIELQSVDLLLEMARAGLGIAFVPAFCLDGSYELIPLNIQEQWPSRKFGLIRMKQIPLSPAGRLFADIF